MKNLWVNFKCTTVSFTGHPVQQWLIQDIYGQLLCGLIG